MSLCGSRQEHCCQSPPYPLISGGQLNSDSSSLLQQAQASAVLDGRRGSTVYEVNSWLWQFGQGKQQLGGLNVEETAQRQEAVLDERLKCGLETHQHWKAKGT